MELDNVSFEGTVKLNAKIINNGDIMIYTEKKISYTDYVRLRESVNWNNFNKEQTENV